MMGNAEIGRLKSFFAAYFHEDWNLDSDEAEDAFEPFLSSAKKAEAMRLADDIKAYVASIPDDAELHERLFSELGCYYDPEADGIASREWLLRVATILSK